MGGTENSSTTSSDIKERIEVRIKLLEKELEKCRVSLVAINNTPGLNELLDLLGRV